MPLANPYALRYSRTLRVGRRQDHQLIILGHWLPVVHGRDLKSHVRTPLVLQHGRHADVWVQLPQRTSFRYSTNTKESEKGACDWVCPLNVSGLLAGACHPPAYLWIRSKHQIKVRKMLLSYE